MAIPIQEIINKSIRDERELKEQNTWYASSLGTCLRGQYIQRLGIVKKEFTDRELRVFKCGKMFEEWITSLLEKEPNIKIEKQVRVEIKDWDASGIIDLIAEYNGEKKIYELKTKHSKAFWHMQKDGKPMRQHQQQLWFYLKATGIKDGSLLYLEKDALSILEYPVRLDDENLEKEVREQLELLNKAWKEKNIELLPLPKEDSWEARYCSFHEKYCLKPKELNKLKLRELN